MKKAMWRVDSTGSYSFSDKQGFDQFHFFTSMNDQALADQLEQELAGREMTVEDVRAYVLCETPFYKFKKPLGSLQKYGAAVPINPPPGQRPGQYPDAKLRLKFKPKGLF
jgi:hypothetical protein